MNTKNCFQLKITPIALNIRQNVKFARMDAKLIIIFCLAAFIAAAILLLKKQQNAPKHEKIKFILKRLEYGRELNRVTINELSQYAKLHNCLTALFMQGITFSTAIMLLQEAETTVFSEENKQKITAANLSLPQLEEGLKKLEIHIQHVVDVRTLFDFHFKNKVRNQNNS